MKLYIAGGTGEHGRNCFYVQGEKLCFLVDCGMMADAPESPYPRLTAEQIRRTDILFLTHSHADHSGAIPWLYKNGFHGIIAADRKTISQLPFTLKNFLTLDALAPEGAGQYGALKIHWGRSGHCAGSVWYCFSEGGKTIFFSGDYTENTLVYRCDPIRNWQADCAVLDCAYGSDETPYADACDRLFRETKELLSLNGLLLLPVPKYGRGLEILKLFAENLREISFYADDLFLENLNEACKGGFWYQPLKIDAAVSRYAGQAQGIVFVSDPQLRSSKGRMIAKQVLSLGGAAVMTGTTEKGSYSAQLIQQGNMVQLSYPVHLNYAQFEKLRSENNFSRSIPYHSGELTADREYIF